MPDVRSFGCKNTNKSYSWYTIYVKKQKSYWYGISHLINFCYLCTRILQNNIFNSFKISMNHYETVFILTPVLSDEQMKETVAKFKKLLTDKGAEILNEETWGLKKMAYAIEKKSTGFYCLLEFKAEPSIVNTLETGFRRDEKVIRFMTVKLDKYAAAYAEKRRAKWAKKLEA